MSERLNLILAVIDGARADHFSCYGYLRETTPFLDQVAGEGIRFSQAISNAPTTLSAHATLFTGLHAVTHGATEETRALPARAGVLAEYLKAAGYRTAAFCTNPWVSPETGFGRGFDAFFTQRRASRLATRALSYGRKASDKLLRREDAGARRSNEALLQWLGEGGEPFFVFLHYQETRLPLHAPPPHDRSFMTPEAATRAHDLDQDAYAYLAGATRWHERDSEILAALYDGALRYLDTRLREVGEALRARGDWDRTLVVVTGDHGQHLGERGLVGHAVGFSDVVLRVPLLLRCPTRVPQGFVGEEIAQLTDICPTVLRLLDVGAGAASFPGRPLFEEGRATKGPTYTVSERFRPNLRAVRQRFPDFDTRPLEVRAKAIRTLRQKFVWHSDEANELYDLVADPGETHNLIDRDAGPADALRRQLFDWLSAVEKYESPARAPVLGDAPASRWREVGTVE
jgi:arylsulfatase A-like enzyme